MLHFKNFYFLHDALNVKYFKVKSLYLMQHDRTRPIKQHSNLLAHCHNEQLQNHSYIFTYIEVVFICNASEVQIQRNQVIYNSIVYFFLNCR